MNRDLKFHEIFDAAGRIVPVISVGSDKSGTVVNLNKISSEQHSSVCISIDPKVQVSFSGGSHLTTIHFYCGTGSSVEYFCNQQFTDEQSLTLKWHVQAESQVACIVAVTGYAGTSTLACELYLEGPNAQARMYGGIVLQAGASMRVSTRQHHNAPAAYSDVKIHSIIGSNCLFDYRGIIDVEAVAVETEASQVLKSIPLSDYAKVMAIPTLQVRTNKVRCTHGAAMATLDPQAIGYLQARGIKQKQAKQLLYHGFLQAAYQEYGAYDRQIFNGMMSSFFKTIVDVF